MIVYPLDFHRRAEQKWARRLKSEVSKSEIVSKAEAERLLKLAIEANKTGGPVNREAAELLVACLDNLSRFQAATRQ